MPKFSHKTLIFLSGMIWLLAGVLLMSLGIHFILDVLKNPQLVGTGKFSLLKLSTKYFTSDIHQAAVMILTAALLAGYIKGKFILSKTVKRQVKRISALPKRVSLKYLYSKGLYFLIAFMILLGNLLRFFPITLDTRGFVDVVIGSALINGCMLFFRAASRYSSQQAERELS